MNDILKTLHACKCPTIEQPYAADVDRLLSILADLEDASDWIAEGETEEEIAERNDYIRCALSSAEEVARQIRCNYPDVQAAFELLSDQETPITLKPEDLDTRLFEF